MLLDRLPYEIKHLSVNRTSLILCKILKFIMCFCIYPLNRKVEKGKSNVK